MSIVVIKHAGFTYRTKNENHKKTVFRGQQLDLSNVSDDCLKRGQRLGAWVEPAVVAAEDAAAQAVADVAPFDEGVRALADWIAKNKPNGPDTVKLAENDPVRAQLLMDAESVAHGQGKARSTVTKPLTAILAHFATHGSEDNEDDTNGADDGADSDDSTGSAEA
jgi:hypothetical protein